MAKNMARLENSLVVNIEWCSDRTEETETLKDIFDRPVWIGDEYFNGKWYRDDSEILTPLEDLQLQNDQLVDAIAQLLEEVYQSDLGMMEE